MRMNRMNSDMYRPTGKYFMVYWLHGQSHLFSDPQIFETDDVERFKEALETAKRCEYDVQYHTEL